jgi:type 1 fimbriae regulatory protein FimB/type 1 fimbriae regulatory protein FimE
VGAGRLRALKGGARRAHAAALLRFRLANDGHDTRALQEWLGHQNVQHTVRYTELTPTRFKSFFEEED